MGLEVFYLSVLGLLDGWRLSIMLLLEYVKYFPPECFLFCLFFGVFRSDA